ncbi:hypothetical protein JCM10207_007322 [Rhodosporidiobolus poonsookiae]
MDTHTATQPAPQLDLPPAAVDDSQPIDEASPPSTRLPADSHGDAAPTQPIAPARDAHEGTAEPADAAALPPKKKQRTSIVPSRSSRRISRLPTPDPVLPSTSGTSGDTEDRADAGDPAASIESDTRGKDGKRYLAAGLYWTDGGVSDASVHRRLPPSDDDDDATDWRAVEPGTSSLFPPPMHHAETLIDEEEPFELPYDILRDFWYAPPSTRGRAADVKGKGKEGDEPVREGKGGDKTTEEDILRREQSKKPEPYKYIRTNVYVDRKPDRAAVPAICMCTPPARANEMGCGEGCINRLMQYCCDVKRCPCGDRCGNTTLTKREGIPEGKDGLRVIWTGNRGFGLKTMVPIKKGQFVIEYRGEIITRNESYRRVLTDYKGKPSYYFLDYDGHEVIDAGQRGNSARFINHSCGPNLQVVRWRLATMEEYQMGIFALHDIPAGTELTYDYGWQDFSSIAPNPSAVAAALVTPPPPATVDTAPVPDTADAPDPAAPAQANADADPTEDARPAFSRASSLSSLSSFAESIADSTVATSTSTPVETKEFTSAILASTDTAIDPSRQRCYCAAPECSGFLGGRKKTSSHKKGGAAAVGAAGGPKGRGRLCVDQGVEGERKDWAPPRSESREGGAAKLVQARFAVSRATGSLVAARVERRGTAGGAARGRKGRDDKGKVVERVVGAMRSGREAAKKALGKLMGGLPPPVDDEDE